MRVVSLLPSATEILAELGALDLLVGRSHECDWPPEVAALPALTAQRTVATGSADIDRQVREALSGRDGSASLYTLDTAALAVLRPDVVLTQDLCEVCSIDLETVRAAAAAMEPVPRIVSLDPATVEDVLEDVVTVAEAIGRPGAGEEAVVRLRDGYWTAVDHVNPYADGPVVAFLEWMDPLFVGGRLTPRLIEAAGGRPALNAPGASSRRITPDELVAAAPERIIVCPCGYDLAAIARELDVLTSASWWGDLPAVRAGRVVAVDGSAMFNRPGPRLVQAFRWLVGWLNDRPELVPEGFPVRGVAGRSGGCQL